MENLDISLPASESSIMIKKKERHASLDDSLALKCDSSFHLTNTETGEVKNSLNEKEHQGYKKDYDQGMPEAANCEVAGSLLGKGVNLLKASRNDSLKNETLLKSNGNKHIKRKRIDDNVLPKLHTSCTVHNDIVLSGEVASTGSGDLSKVNNYMPRETDSNSDEARSSTAKKPRRHNKREKYSASSPSDSIGCSSTEAVRNSTISNSTPLPISDGAAAADANLKMLSCNSILSPAKNESDDGKGHKKISDYNLINLPLNQSIADAGSSLTSVNMQFSHQPDLRGSAKSNLEHSVDAEGVHSQKRGTINPKNRKRHVPEAYSAYSRKKRPVKIKSHGMTVDLDNHDTKVEQEEDASRISQEVVLSRSASEKIHSDCDAAISLSSSLIVEAIDATVSLIPSDKKNNLMNSSGGDDTNTSFQIIDASMDEVPVKCSVTQEAALQNVGSVCKSEGSHCMHFQNHNERDVPLMDREVTSSSLICCKGDVASSQLVIEEVNGFDSSAISLGKTGTIPSRKKLLVLDLNGLLADVNMFYQFAHRSEKRLGMKAVYKRPYCDDFLKFCIEKFDVGVWSSRRKNNVDGLVDYLMKDIKHRLLFCWDQSKCTETGHATIGNPHKPLVLKELKKLWNKEEPDLPWEMGDYSPSNTLLVDDSPYKALCNPLYTAIFPHPFQVRNENDNSLGPGGDIRVYLDGIALAEDVQKYVEEHPFGQRAITESNPSWRFYSQIIEKVKISSGET